MNFDLQPTLENDLLILRPLKTVDFEELYKVASDPLIWQQHPEKNRFQREVFEIFFKEAIDSGGAFAVINKKTGTIIGSTRFTRPRGNQNAIEIGWTFLARSFWGGQYNKSMKLLLIDYAFNFVENILLFVDENNIRSQLAVEKLGGERIIELENQVVDPKKKTNVIYKISKQTPIR